MSTLPAYGFGRPGGFIASYGFGRNILTREVRELMKFAVQVYRQIRWNVDR